MDEIAEHGIKIYQLPDADSDEDEEFKEQTRVLKVREGHTAELHQTLLSAGFLTDIVLLLSIIASLHSDTFIFRISFP